MMKNIVFLFLALLYLTNAYAQKSFGFGYKIENKHTIVTVLYTYGPAAKAGLQKGDIITKVNDIDFTTLDTALVATTFFNAKENSAFEASRNGAVVKMTIVKAERNSFSNLCIWGDCKNGKGVFVEADGNEYNGAFSNAQKMGYGKMKFSNGKVYKGNWVNNKAEGPGEMLFENGDTYAGNWNIGDISGNGIYTSANGDIYTGIFKKNRFNGTVIHFVKSSNETFTEIYNEGVFISSKKDETSTSTNTNPNAKFVTETYTNGDKFEGYNVNGIKDGKGTYTYKDGDVFVGEYKEGKINGFGNATFKDGDSYEGNFENGLKQGFGKYTFKRGEFYEGNWVNNKRNGFGKFVNASGVEFEGNWKDGIKDGAIKKTEKNGNVTLQNWTNGKQNGKSIATVYESGKLQFTLEAQYVDDKETGNPKITYPNGNVYEGDWMYGTPYGIGTLTTKNGDAFKGYFGRGKKYGLIEFTPKKGKQITQYYKNDTLNGVFTNGKVNFNNGDIFEGLFKDGLEEGPGKLTTQKETLTGNWKRGLLQGEVTSVSKAGGSITTYQYKDGKLITADGANNPNLNTGVSNTSANETATLLKETLNGKFDIMEGAPLVYTLKIKKTNEILRYKIEFINDGTQNLAFKWKESTKNEQSEKLVLNNMALASGTKYINFFTVKSGPLPPAAIMFILSRNQYDYLNDNGELKLDVGNGVQTFIFDKPSFPYLKKYAQNAKLKNLQTKDEQTKVELLNNRICPVIVEIETPEFVFTLD